MSAPVCIKNLMKNPSSVSNVTKCGASVCEL